MNEQTRHIAIDEFDYPLPDERIAKFPLAQRDSSKLLLYRSGEVSEDRFASLPDYLPSGALMVFNNTRVIQARLHFRKETGAQRGLLPRTARTERVCADVCADRAV